MSALPIEIVPYRPDHAEAWRSLNEHWILAGGYAIEAKDERVLKGRSPFDGATVVNLSPAVAQDLGVDPFAGRGVLVTKIGQGFALNAGLRPGDFIREVNGKAITTTAELAAVSNAGAATWAVTIERNGQRITARLRA